MTTCQVGQVAMLKLQVCEVLVLIERNKRLTPKSLRHSETYDDIQASFSNFYLALF